MRVRRNAAAVPERPDWVEASVRIESVGAAVLDMLALGAEVEVLHPAALRAEVGETARRLASLYADGAAGPVPDGAGPVPDGAGPTPDGAGPAPVPGRAVPADLS